MNRIAYVALAAVLSTFAFACTADGTGTTEDEQTSAASTHEIDAVGAPKQMANMAQKGFRSDLDAKRTDDVKAALKESAGPESTPEDLAQIEKATGHKGAAEMTTDEIAKVENAMGLPASTILDVRTDLQVDGTVRYAK